MKVNKEFLKQLKPCAYRWENYLKHYSTWEGSLFDFMYLDKISNDDKIWVFTRDIKGIEKLQRKFAVIYAANYDAYYTAIYAADCAAKSAAHYAANYAYSAANYAYSAAYSEREIQVDIIKYVLFNNEGEIR